MVFSIVICVLLLAIVFFHYLQGFFSSALSAIISVISAVLAFSMHEWVAESLLKGKLGNNGHAAILVALFAVFYLLLRTVFDKAVPGNVRLPAALDRVGGAIMGLVAGCFAMGIFVIAAEELPFGPDIAGYTKYDSGDTNAQVPGRSGRLLDGFMYDTLHSEEAGRYEESDRKSLFPPVDEIVLATVRHLSETGSLQGGQPLTEIHPDFLQELNGQRSGIPAGGLHVALNLPNQATPAVTLDGIYAVPQVRIEDIYLDSVRHAIPKVNLTKIREVTEQVGIEFATNKPIERKTQVAGPDHKTQLLIVARVFFGPDAADRDDGIVRFSPGSIRLVAKWPQKGSGAMETHDYYPVGTVEFDPKNPATPILYADKPDDYLMVDVRGKGGDVKTGVDLAFVVERQGFLQGPDKMTIADGAFLEIKREFRESLDGKPITIWHRPPATELVAVIHQGEEQREQQAAAPAPTPAPAPAPAANNPSQPGPASAPSPAPAANMDKLLDIVALQQTNLLPTPIGLPSSELGKNLISRPGITTVTLKDKKFQDLIVDPQALVADLGKGDFVTRDLYVPDTKSLIQVVSNTPAHSWAFAQKIASMTLVDSAGGENKPAGVFVIVNDGGDKLYARYAGNPDYPITADQLNPTPTTGTPTRIYIAFMLPTGATPKQLKVDNQVVKDLSAMTVQK